MPITFSSSIRGASSNMATAGGLTLVTFDRGLRDKAKIAILLRPVADASA